MRKLVVILFGTILMVLAANAQQFDVAVGAGSVTAPSAADATGDHSPQSVGGGTFLGFSGDYLFKRNFGIGGEISWRATQNSYAGILPFRPIFFDFNGVYAPPLGKHAAAELQAGIGAESVRFYQNFTVNCSQFTGTCTNYTSSNHFLGHFSAGIRYYVHGNFFIRPEAHLYLVNNNFEFSGARATRFGASIGYSFGRQ